MDNPIVPSRLISEPINVCKLWFVYKYEKRTNQTADWGQESNLIGKERSDHKMLLG